MLHNRSCMLEDAEKRIHRNGRMQRIRVDMGRRKEEDGGEKEWQEEEDEEE